MPPVPIPRAGRPKSHRYNITPRGFSKLHPVHYRIFDFLKEEIPVTLIQTCRELYLELISKIYERVEITEKNYEDVIDGATINPKGTRKPPKVNRDPTRWETRSTSSRGQGICSGYKWRYRNSLPLPGLKDRALAHTKVLSFTHHQDAIDFVEDSSYCRLNDGCNDKHTLAKDTFLNVEHVHLGEDAVGTLLKSYGVNHNLTSFAKDNHRLVELFRNLWKHCQPTTICVDWPKIGRNPVIDFSGHQNEGEKASEGWAISLGSFKFLHEIRRNESVLYIILHLDLEGIRAVDLGSYWVYPTEQTMVVLCLDKLESSEIATTIETLYGHFQVAQGLPCLPFKYCLPRLINYGEAFDEAEQTLCITSEDRDTFASFKKALEVNSKPCSCRADTL